MKKGLTYWKANNDNNMKFNAVIGNPPYQENDGSGIAGDGANPLYQHFVEISKLIRPKYISFIMPSKWMIGGKAILKSFREKMIKDHQIRKFFDFEDSRECFPGQNIDGGVCFFLWEKGYSGKISHTYKPSNEPAFSENRFLSEGSVIIRDTRRVSLINKITHNKSFLSLKNIVSARKPFGIGTDLFNNKEKYTELYLSEEKFKDSILIHGVTGIKGGAKRVKGHIKKNTIKKKRRWIESYKLFVPKGWSANAIDPPKLIKAGKNEICTETFLVIGPFDSEYEQECCHKYTQTDFFKTLLFFGRGTMQVSRDVFKLIPLQDFTRSSDISWSKEIPEIDNQLFKKHMLDKKEITVVKNTIKKYRKTKRIKKPIKK